MFYSCFFLLGAWSLFYVLVQIGEGVWFLLDGLRFTLDGWILESFLCASVFVTGYQINQFIMLTVKLFLLS